MKEIEVYRKEIDAIDQQLLALLEQRMKCSKEIVAYKKQHDLPIFQPRREQAVVYKSCQGVNDASKPYVISFMKQVMQLSKQYQQAFLEGSASNSPVRQKNIVLLGMPGAGKSSIAKELGAILQRPVIDSDAYLEAMYGQSISTMMQENEATFRSRETKCYQWLSTLDDVIIATGGGVVTDDTNIAYLQKNGILVYIDRPITNIIQDIDVTTRPLLQSNPDNLHALYEKRHSKYLQACHIRIDNTGTIVQTVQKIIQALAG